MKESIRKSLLLYGYVDRIKIIIVLLKLKLKIKLSSSQQKKLLENDEYVKLIELKATFKKAGDKLKAFFIINNTLSPFILRKNSSDLKVFKSVIVMQEYKTAIDYFLSTKKNNKENIIIDAGGNIGLTSVYLHRFLPGSRFVIIEPDSGNANLLEQNLKLNKISDFTLLKNALWTKNEWLSISNSFRDGQEWSLTVEAKKEQEDNADSLIGITLQEIIRTNNFEKVDLFKIDIEGAERFLFNDKTFIETINKYVDAIIIEIHDEFNIRELIYDTMNKIGFRCIDSGSVTLFVRL